MLNYNIILLWFSVFLFGCQGQTDTKPETIKTLTAEEKIYYEDAARLALRDLIKTCPDSVNIPDKEIKKYLEALMAIHKYIIKKGDTQSLAANTHTGGNPEMHKFAIGIDSSAKWIKYWIKYRDKTGDKAIDSLMNTYNVQIENYSETPDRSIVFFKTAKPENIAALAKKFKTIKNSAPYPISQMETGQDITAKTEGGKWIFTYQSIPENKSWHFMVDKDFKVGQGVQPELLPTSPKNIPAP